MMNTFRGLLCLLLVLWAVADCSIQDVVAQEPQSAANQEAQPPTEQTPQTQPAQPQFQPRPAQRQQPAPATSPFATTGAGSSMALTSVFGRDHSAGTRRRLTRVPDMFGDSFYHGGTLTAFDANAGIDSMFSVSDMALAGGARRLKVGENNKALPVDRVYFNYNYYSNALKSFASNQLFLAPTLRESLSVHRYTVGWEKTLADGRYSVELRMPFTGDQDVHFLPNPAKPDVRFDQSVGDIGNLSIIMKSLLYADGDTAIAAGLAVETPTGSDAETRNYFTHYELENEATHLSPFVGLMAIPDDDFFVHGFVQIDFPTVGNTLRFRDATAQVGNPPRGSYGKLNDQTLLYLDLSTGYWLLRDSRGRSWLTGAAALAEVHYTTPLQSSDVVAGTRVPTVGGDSTALLRNRGGRVDVVNFTTGLHLEIWNDTVLRTAGVFPFGGGDNRFFDAELIVQLTRRF